MANSNFIVHNGLTVGPLTIDAATGSINTPGTVTVTGGLAVSTISKNDSSISINDTGTGSSVVIAIDGVTEHTLTATLTSLATALSVTGNVVAGSGTTSTTTTTGALVVVGGAGVSGALNIGGATQAAAITSSGTIIASAVNAGTIGNASATLTGTLSTATQNSVTTMTGLTGFGTASVVTTAAGHLTVTGNLTVNGTQNIINNTIYETTEYVVNQNATNGNIGTLVATTGFSAANAVITGGSINNTTVGATTHNTGRFTTVTATTVNAGTIGNSGATLTGTLSTAAQSSVTSVGSLTGLTVNGLSAFNSNISLPSAGGSCEIKAGTGDNATYSSYNMAIKSWWGIGFRDYTDSNIAKLVIDCRTGNVSSVGSMIAGTVVAGTINAGTIGNASATLTGTLSTAAQTNVTSVGTLTGLTVSGAIVPSANLTINVGSASAWFNTFFGVSTQAKYADLAENYQADKSYNPGTVLMFGGTYEVTLADAATTAVAGVVSTNPAHLMNGQLSGSNVVPLALTGRVPCMVIGPVKKGDMMVSAGFGYAKSSESPQLGQVIGKALQDFPINAKGVIEVVVGRL
jgi:hypothetical protein